MKTSIDTRFLLIGVIVTIPGIVKNFVPGLPNLSLHPLGIMNAVPGYYLMIAGIVIIIVGVLVGLIVNREY